ncbi:MAG TPA: hypothetical protein VM841_07170, partial [Actinomycetota bacterium]|nr:hypothetical protein [Actinomycetota bacterium]
EIIWFGAAAAMFLAAWKTKSDWVRASLAGFALSILAIRVLAVLPSWWLYYAEGTLDWGGQGCAEIDLQCIKQTIKDSVVVVQNAVILGALVVGFIIWQKKFPKQLAPGESKPEATGGYK